MDILVIFLFVAVGIALLMHLHFKNAPEGRTALVGPPVFAVIGALIGLSAGMMWLWADSEASWEGRIDLEQGVMHAVVGAVVGGFVGLGAQSLFARFPRVRVAGVVLTLILLAASIGAPIGWLYGDISRNLASDPVQATQRGMLWGSVLGGAVGLALGLFEACFGRKHTTSAAGPAENAIS